MHQVIVKNASRIAAPSRILNTSTAFERNENALTVTGIYRCNAGQKSLTFRKIDFAERKRKAFYRRVNTLLGGF